MSQVKITELPVIENINANTSNTLYLGVDVETGVTGKMTLTTLAQGLYSNNKLSVGNNDTLLANAIGQFTGDANPYLQISLQNTNDQGSGDIVITADHGTDSTYYIDMGMAGSNYVYEGDTINNPGDGYLLMVGDGNEPGGNLSIGTLDSSKFINFFQGGLDRANNLIAKFDDSGRFQLVRTPIRFADNTTQNTAPWIAISGNVATMRGEVTANAASANSVINTRITANVATLRGEITANAASANSVINTLISANVATLRDEITANAASANLVIDTRITANAASANAVIDANISANVVILRGEIAANAESTNAFANLAFTKANNALANATGSFDGDLTVLGNLVTRSITTSTLVSFVGSDAPASNALVEIIGSIGGAQVAPASDGYMVHVTGKDGIANKIIFDSFGTGAYPLVAGRSARGSANTPLATQNNDVLMRVSSGGWGTTGFAPLGSGRIDFVATENYTDSARGSKIVFYNVVNGTNTISEIATFNATSAEFFGAINPQKGLIYTPRVINDVVTDLNVNYANDSLIKSNVQSTFTITHSNFTAGKVVEVWLTNISGSTETVTHGLSATNSTTNSTTFTMPSTSSAYMRFFSIDGDLANTFVSIINA